MSTKYSLHVVYGDDALQLPTIENWTREEVKVWHDKYIAALFKVFEDNKCNVYGWGRRGQDEELGVVVESQWQVDRLVEALAGIAGTTILHCALVHLMSI